MLRSVTPLLLGPALALIGCSETPAPAARIQPVVRAVTGVYAIDLDATRKIGGLFGAMIVGAVTGSTLELGPDRTYVGRKDGKVELQGRWEMVGDELRMHPGAADASPGRGRFIGDRLTVHTEDSGLPVTLVFRRPDAN